MDIEVNNNATPLVKLVLDQCSLLFQKALEMKLISYNEKQQLVIEPNSRDQLKGYLLEARKVSDEINKISFIQI